MNYVEGVYGMKLWNSLEKDLKCGSNIITFIRQM